MSTTLILFILTNGYFIIPFAFCRMGLNFSVRGRRRNLARGAGSAKTGTENGTNYEGFPSLLGPNIRLRILSSNTLSLYSSLNVRDSASQVVQLTTWTLS